MKKEFENPFHLYSSEEYLESSIKATNEIEQLIHKFIMDLKSIENKYRHTGAYDTASREAIALYIAKEKLNIVKL